MLDAMKRIALLLLLLSALPATSAKQRDWKEAKLTSISVNDSGTAVVMPVGAGLVGGRIYFANYRFEMPDLIVVASANARKHFNLTVNKVTRIASDKNNLYVIDDDGKEIKLSIVGKRAR